MTLFPYWWEDINDFLFDFNDGVEYAEDLKNEYYENYLAKEKEVKTLRESLQAARNSMPEYFL